MLFQTVEQLLARHGVDVNSLEGFAAASGPGSFTGVRVGLSAVKGLAEATGKKVVAVSNLRALASFGSAPLRAAVIDARRGEIYGAVFDDQLKAVSAECVMRFTDWLSVLPDAGIEFVCADFSPWRDAAPPAIPVVTAPRALAAAIGRIAAREFSNGRALDPAEIDANYVRRSDAELLWRD